MSFFQVTAKETVASVGISVEGCDGSHGGCGHHYLVGMPVAEDSAPAGVPRDSGNG